MVDFAVHALPMIEAGIKVVAASVDPIETTATLKEGLHVGFPIYAEADPRAIVEATGAAMQEGDRTFLHATGFVVDPEGIIVNAVYSTGPIGRYTASEVIRKVLFEQRKRNS